MKEFTLTPEEEQVIQDYVRNASYENKEESLPIGIESDIDEFIICLKETWERIKHENPEIIEDTHYVLIRSIPDEWEEGIVYDKVYINYSVKVNKPQIYETRKYEVLKDKRRRYEEYLRLEKEFGDD